MTKTTPDSYSVLQTNKKFAQLSSLVLIYKELALNSDFLIFPGSPTQR